MSNREIADDTIFGPYFGDGAPDQAVMIREKRKLYRVVQRFSVKMINKLNEKVDEGWGGWDDPELKDRLIIKMLEHCLECFKMGSAKEAVDIANFAMFIDWIENEKEKP